MTTPSREQASRLFSQEYWLELFKLLQPFVQKSNNTAWIKQYYGAAAFHCQELNHAEESLRQAIILEPKQGWSYYFLGRTLAAKDNTTEAELMLSVASRYLPNEFWPSFFLLEILLKSGNYIAAQALFIQCSKRFKGNPHLISLARREPSLAKLVEKNMGYAGSLENIVELRNGQIFITGWSLSPAPQDLLRVEINGKQRTIKALVKGIPRPDASQTYGYSNINLGFILGLNRSKLEKNSHIDYFWQEEKVTMNIKTINDEPWPQNAETLLAILDINTLSPRHAIDIFNGNIGNSLLYLQSQVKGKENIYNAIQASYSFGPNKPGNAAEVSIVIPIYGRWDFIITQLIAFSRDPWFISGRVELIYVLDDPKLAPELLNWAEGFGEHLLVPFSILILDKNYGFSTATNIGVAKSTANYCCLLNSDIFPINAEWLAPLLGHIKENHNAGVVAPLLLYPDGSVQHAGMIYMISPKIPGIRLNIHPGKGLHWTGGSHPRTVQALSGAAMLIKRSNYDLVGGLITQFIRGDFEDSHLCEQLKSLGLNCILMPDVQLVHAERQSFPKSDSGDNHANWRVLANAWLAEKLLSPNPKK